MGVEGLSCPPLLDQDHCTRSPTVPPVGRPCEEGARAGASSGRPCLPLYLLPSVAFQNLFASWLRHPLMESPCPEDSQPPPPPPPPPGPQLLRGRNATASAGGKGPARPLRRDRHQVCSNRTAQKRPLFPRLSCSLGGFWAPGGRSRNEGGQGLPPAGRVRPVGRGRPAYERGPGRLCVPAERGQAGGRPARWPWPADRPWGGLRVPSALCCLQRRPAFSSDGFLAHPAPRHDYTSPLA